MNALKMGFFFTFFFPQKHKGEEFTKKKRAFLFIHVEVYCLTILVIL